MAFQTKKDFAGLATTFSQALVIRDDNENNSQETYIPQGQDGSFVAIEVYGADASPSNSYGVKADLSASSGALKLGDVNTVGTGKYALESVSISTSAGSSPTISATSQMVESAATTGDVYNIPAFTVSKKQAAQILFSAFTLPASGCTLTSCNANIRCSIGKDKVAGAIIASDVNSGMIEVSGTVLQLGDTAPTVTAASGWTMTAPLVCTNPETAYPSWSFTVRKNLEKTTPQSAS